MPENLLFFLIFPLSVLLCSCTVPPPPAPLSEAGKRPSALRFGMYVTPDRGRNPIDPPERFTGYHAGLDYEIFDGESDAEVPVLVVCDGMILYSGYVDGYGGVVVQRCHMGGERVSVLYGHLGSGGLAPVGTTVKSPTVIGQLAAPRSHWSGGNRKHLHLGIHRGGQTDMRGYVETQKELKDFLDPALVLPGRSGRPVERYVVER